MFHINKQLTGSHIFSTNQKHLESNISLHTFTNSTWFLPSDNRKYWHAAKRLILRFCCPDLHFSTETHTRFTKYCFLHVSRFNGQPRVTCSLSQL